MVNVALSFTESSPLLWKPKDAGPTGFKESILYQAFHHYHSFLGITASEAESLSEPLGLWWYHERPTFMRHRSIAGQHLKTPRTSKRHFANLKAMGLVERWPRFQERKDGSFGRQRGSYMTFYGLVAALEVLMEDAPRPKGKVPKYVLKRCGVTSEEELGKPVGPDYRAWYPDRTVRVDVEDGKKRRTSFMKRMRELGESGGISPTDVAREVRANFPRSGVKNVTPWGDQNVTPRRGSYSEEGIRKKRRPEDRSSGGPIDGGKDGLNDEGVHENTILKRSSDDDNSERFEHDQGKNSFKEPEVGSEEISEIPGYCKDTVAADPGAPEDRCSSPPVEDAPTSPVEASVSFADRLTTLTTKTIPEALARAKKTLTASKTKPVGSLKELAARCADAKDDKEVRRFRVDFLEKIYSEDMQKYPRYRHRPWKEKSSARERAQVALLFDKAQVKDHESFAQLVDVVDVIVNNYERYTKPEKRSEYPFPLLGFIYAIYDRISYGVLAYKELLDLTEEQSAWNKTHPNERFPEELLDRIAVCRREAAAIGLLG